MTDRYTKLTKAIQTSKTNDTTVASIFLEHSVANYGIPFELLTKNGSQFVSKFFLAVCITLRVNYITNTEYYPQTNGQAERFNSTVISRLQHYVSVHQTHCDIFLLPLTYACNVHVYRPIKVFPCRFELTQTSVNRPRSYRNVIAQGRTTTSRPQCPWV